MTELHILRVFCGPGGTAGNALGVVRDGGAVTGERERQAVAAELGFSETVFVDDAVRGRVDIYTPSVRLLFAGHPLVGTGWLLRREGSALDVLRPPAGDVPLRQDEEFSWIRARAQWAAGRRTQQFASVAEVDALPAPPEGSGWLYAWAWQDEAAGRVRARAFPRRGDNIAEDEATGAAALVLTGELGRALDIRQGVGSQILTRPHADGTIEVGGRVVLESIREL
ncbi:PhzF family phenazine biosynthesis protein [Kitasatospora kifunensis]|uniref:Putative PhzF superfamily epimerase YddE/YHI9 n=1 Tax=Kitasatospora kifunensis TaxID=58351 RepID=A0A7W7R056_KITKI|nr:PhzF family phenazine biosynthesis protein [Kitasatospora kifunensis]MBB4922729.1 putative PhzF superfamily epimerase YddE/YHI9 [Kitasatospora kifunensis]